MSFNFNVDPGILNYIRLNRSKYNRQAIDQQLLQAGFSQEAINEGWRIIESETPAATNKGYFRNTEFWLGIAATMGYMFVGSGLIFGMLYQISSRYGGQIAGALSVISYVIASVLLWKKHRPFVMGLWFAFVILATLAFLFFLVIWGICKAMGYPY